jgi:hypothetical protein
MIEKYSLVQLSIKRSRTHDKQKPCDTLETSGPGSLPAAARPLPTLRETGRPEGPRNRSHVIQRGHAGADTDTADNRHAYQPPGRPRTQTLPRSLTYRASSTSIKLARGCLPNTSDLPNSPSGMGVNRQDVRSSLFALRARRLASGPADAGASGS